MNHKDNNSRLPKRVAIIGAGLCGATAAHRLNHAGFNVTLFEKSRGAGGRMSTRQIDELQFDHGAQYFTARNPRLQQSVDRWIEQGIVKPWNPRIGVLDRDGMKIQTTSVQRFVAVPKMTSIAKALTADLQARFSTHIETVQIRQSDRLSCIDREGIVHDEFDFVVVATPAPQARQLLSAFASMHQLLDSVVMEPCWAVMVVLKTKLELPWDAAFINVGPLRWVAQNQTKPGRDETAQTLVLHSNSEWTQKNLERETDDVAAELLVAFFETIRIQPIEAVTLSAHRWRYSIPQKPLEQTFVATLDNRVFAAGDWAGGPRVEGAFLSGIDVADRIIHVSENLIV